MTREEMYSLGAAAEPPRAAAVFDGSPDRSRQGFFFGLLPGDQGGQGIAYMPTEGVNVLREGKWSVAGHAHAANFHNLLKEPGGEVRQRFETQTVNLDIRRGVKVGIIPAVELGVKLQAHRRSDGGGALSGFIADFERAIGSYSRRYGERAVHGGSEELVMQDGRILRARGGGTGLQLGDVGLIAKALLLDSAEGPLLKGLSITGRVVGNIAAGGDLFSSGNFAGYGLTFQLPLTERLAMHVDSRRTFAFDARDALGNGRLLTSMGMSAGLEYMLVKRITSFVFQADWEERKLKKNSPAGFAQDQLFLTFGLNQAIPVNGKCVIAKLYGREDLNPDKVNKRDAFNPYGPPDFSAGALLSFEWDRAKCVTQ